MNSCNWIHLCRYFRELFYLFYQYGPNAVFTDNAAFFLRFLADFLISQIMDNPKNQENIFRPFNCIFETCILFKRHICVFSVLFPLIWNRSIFRSTCSWNILAQTTDPNWCCASVLKSNNQIFRNVIERVKVYSGQYPSSNNNFASNWNINFDPNDFVIVTIPNFLSAVDLTFR